MNNAPDAGDMDSEEDSKWQIRALQATRLTRKFAIPLSALPMRRGFDDVVGLAHLTLRERVLLYDICIQWRISVSFRQALSRLAGLLFLARLTWRLRRLDFHVLEREAGKGYLLLIDGGPVYFALLGGGVCGSSFWCCRLGGFLGSGSAFTCGHDGWTREKGKIMGLL
jgi:hypothetical protein